MGVFKSHAKHFAFWDMETHHDAKLKDYKLYTHTHTQKTRQIPKAINIVSKFRQDIK